MICAHPAMPRSVGGRAQPHRRPLQRQADGPEWPECPGHVDPDGPMPSVVAGPWGRALEGTGGGVCNASPLPSRRCPGPAARGGPTGGSARVAQGRRTHKAPMCEGVAQTVLAITPDPPPCLRWCLGAVRCQSKIRQRITALGYTCPNSAFAKIKDSNTRQTQSPQSVVRVLNNGPKDFPMSSTRFDRVHSAKKPTYGHMIIWTIVKGRRLG